MNDCFCISVNRKSRKREFTASACFGMLRNIGLGSPLGRKARLTEFTLGKGHLLNRKYHFLYNKQIVSCGVFLYGIYALVNLFHKTQMNACRNAMRQHFP